MLARAESMPPVTPGGPSPLDQLLDDALNFIFDCKPKDALAVLHKVLSGYENRLKSIGSHQHFPIIEEVLLSQFQDQVPNFFDNMNVILQSTFEVGLQNVEKIQSRMLVSKKGMAVSKEKEKEFLLDAFRKRIEQNFPVPLPSSITNRYVNYFKEILNALFEEQVATKTVPRIASKEWQEFCVEFIRDVSNKKMKLFDEKEMKITALERRDLFIGTAYAFAFTEKNHFKEEKIQWVGIVDKLCDLLPKDEVALKEREKILTHILNDIGKSEQEIESAYGQLMLCTFMPKFNVHQFKHFTASLFSIISGFYTTEGSFEQFDYKPVLRNAVKRMIKGLATMIKGDAISEYAESLISFKRYKQFEQVLGQFLGISLEMGKWNDYGEKNLLSQMKRSSVVPKYFDLVQYIQNVSTIASSELLTLTNLTPERCSPHAVICFSGFLSQADDQENNWKNLITFDQESSIYAVKWASRTLWSALRPSLAGLGIATIEGLYSGGISLAMAGLSLLKATQKGLEQFQSAEAQAKKVGRLMAHIISNSDIFKGQCVSLVGFSMGVRAALECIKELSKIHKEGNDNKVINDVIMLGGAKILKGAKMKEWQTRFGIISGRIINVYATNDWALKLMGVVKDAIVKGDYPVGLTKIEFEKHLKKEEEDYKKVVVENFDVTSIVSGHMWYRSNLGQILKKIGFE